MPVPNVVGIKQELAVVKIQDAGLTPNVVHEANEDVPAGVVADQDPGAGNRIDKGNTVTILVSKGKPTTQVPDVRGKSETDAVATLANAKLTSKVAQIFSDQPQGTVTAQDPKAGTQRRRGHPRADQRLRQGVKPVAVPSVITESFDQASAELDRAGLQGRPQRRRVDPVAGDRARAGSRRRHAARSPARRSRSPSRRARRRRSSPT